METAKIFAANLKHRRIELGLTQKQLAESFGYSEKSVSKWESGAAIAPSAILPKLAEALATSIDSLFDSLSEPMYYLGIDGGGTKTEFLLCDKDGQPVSRAFLSACNPVDVGFDRAFEVLKKGIAEVCSGVPLKKVAGYAGIAGGTTGDNSQKIGNFLSRFGFFRAENGSDAHNAVAAALGSRNGISVILGTGNVVYTQKDGTLYRTGGFGYLFDDCGSGYSIGRDGILAALKAEQNAAKSTSLTELIREKSGKSRVIDALPDFYLGGKREIASYAPLVFSAYETGDKEAENILWQNFSSVAQLICDASAYLDEDAVTVSLTGSIANGRDVINMIEKRLTEICTHKKFNISASSVPPVTGAVSLARGRAQDEKDN